MDESTYIPNESESQTAPMSKNQLKRQKKHERWLEGREERRKFERQKRKLKRKSLAQQRDELGEAFVNPRRYNLMKSSNNKIKIVIDLDFADYMTENEISKAVQQVARIYAANRHSENPSQLYLTSLKGKILDRFAIMNKGYTNWDINHTEKDYTEFFNDTTSDIESKDQFIYLTADTDDTLPSVDDLLKDYQSTIFIIGGLVDHNRHTKLCFNRAQQRGVRTAKLPITDHVKLNQRQILSTVNVFEILLDAFSSHKPWSEIMLNKIPKRKIAQADDDKQDSNKSPQ